MPGLLFRAFALAGFSLAASAALSAPAFQQGPASGLLVVEAEHFDLSVSQGGHDWVPASEPGASGDGSLVTTPDSETNRDTGFETNSPRLDYVARFTQPGTYYVWVRGLGPESRDDSLHIGIDGAGQASSDRITGFGTSFGWSNATMDPERATLVIPAAGEYTLNAWMREDGFVFDKLLLTPDPAFTPDGLGPDVTPRAESGAFLSFNTGWLDFDTDQGSGLSGPQTVSLAASDGGQVPVGLDASEAWLNVSPGAGETPLAGIDVRVDATGLSPGAYAGQVTAAGDGYADAVINVSSTVVGDEVIFEAEEATLGGGAVTGDRKPGFTGSGYVELRSTGSVSWSVNVPETGVYRLTFRNSVGIGDRKITLSVDGQTQPEPTIFPATSSWKNWSDTSVDLSLAAGVRTLTLASPQKRGPNIDHLRVAGAGPATPALAFDTASLSFSVDEDSGLSAPQAVGLGTSDGSTAAVTLGASQSWLEVSPSSGSTPLSGIQIRIDPAGLAPGAYSATVSASAAGFSSDSVTVSLTVNGSAPPPGSGGDTIYETEDANLSSVIVNNRYGGFTGTGYGEFRNSGAATWTVSVPEAGTYTLALRYAVGIKDRKASLSIDGADVSALTSLPSTGAWTNWSEVEIQQTLTAGAHQVRLSSPTLRGPNVDHLRVSGAGGGGQPSLVLSPAALNFTIAAGSGLSVPKGLSVTASDGSTPQVSLTPSASWLVADPDAGAAPLNGSVRVNGASLATGIRSATLLAEAPGYGPAEVDVQVEVTGSLPIVYDFDGGDASGWNIVRENDSVPDWQVQDGRFVQLAAATGSVTVPDTYLEGTYAFVALPAGADDYAFSVEIESLETSLLRRGEDLGVLFRRADGNNFYRLSLNSKFGYTRLERTIAGQTTTLAVTSQGYRPGEVLRLGVRVEGPLIMVFRDDTGGATPLFDQEPYLAAWDDNLPAGDIALYTRGAVAFDNVRVDALASGGRVAVSQPLPYAVMPGGNIDVEAVAQGIPSGASVRFEINGNRCSAASEFRTGVFRATCPEPAVGENRVTAVLFDGNVELDRHDQRPVGSGGEKTITLGDSITNGFADDFLADGISQPVLVAGQPSGPRQISFQGYQAPLADGLSGDAGFNRPIALFNEGIPGERSDGLLIDRLPSILERHAGTATLALMQIGTNDANRNELLPGTGCSGAACDGTFKGYVRDTVLALQDEGIKPYLARIPPIFGRFGRNPYTDPLATGLPNERVIAYNEAIAEVVSESGTGTFGTENGPDFFSFFLGDGENRLSLFDDNIHPNALGYQLIAWLWHESLRPGGSGTRPLVLEDICVRTTRSTCRNPMVYKQTLMETGNAYYVDQDVVVTDIPSRLEGGVFLRTADDDKTVTRSDYLEFSVDRDVDVYVAFPPNATTPPNWMAGFANTGETLGVSAGTPTLNLYRASFGPGTVRLGGPSATGANPTPSNNYVVIVVPR